MLPRLSPQVWLVVVASRGNDDVKTLDDVRSLLNSSSPTYANDYSTNGMEADSESGLEEPNRPLLSARLDETVCVISKRFVLFCSDSFNIF